MPSNSERVSWAQDAVNAFVDHAGTGLRGDWQTAIADLIGDLGHLADEYGVDFVKAVERGVGMWSAEKRAPDGDPDINDGATVLIDRV